MSKDMRDSDYDLFAWFYNKYWGSGPASFAMRALPILDKLLLSSLPPTARVLDLCCGTGQLAHALTVRGFEVMGIDASIEMLRYARTNAPTAEFLLADARAFTLPPVYHGAVSLYDSLNHLLSLEDLAKVFSNVEAALAPGGRFFFDLNMDEGYRARWRGSFGFAENDHACVIQSAYHPEDRTGRFDATLFRLEKGTWQRSDLKLFQRSHSEDEVRTALRSAGFEEILASDAEKDHGMRGEVGRTFFLARKRYRSPLRERLDASDYPLC